jgi:Ca2+-binding EF-hand superfamily protein
MDKIFAISAISLSVLFGTVTLAQSIPGAATPSSGVVGKYDKDNDQTLDLNEVKAAASAHFDKLDKNADGTLDSAEVQGVIGKKTFKAADPDNDGTLTKDEYLALVEKLFNKVDVDHDGTLSVQELKSKTAHALKRLIN